MTGIPVAVWSGSFRLFGVDLKCHVLDDGQRVIEPESMEAMFDAMGSEGSVEIGDIESFTQWQRGPTNTPERPGRG